MNQYFKTHCYWPFWLLITYVFLYQLSYPILVGDTDMWYHLNGGRQTWLTGAVHHSTFFSFISPEREWVNYYWGFQALIFKIYDLFDYYGLIVFRAILNTAIAVLLFMYLKDVIERTRIKAPILMLALFALLLVMMEGRGYQVRPHMTSYVFILMFLWILEFRHNYVWLLPIIMVFWVNLHGVEYVIPALICGAYGLEALVHYKYHSEKPKPIYIISLLLCAPALLVNPYAFDVLMAPFNLPEHVEYFIRELKAVPFGEIVNIPLTGTKIHPATAFIMLFSMFVVLLVLSVRKKQYRVSHLILLVGAAILLSKGVRFMWEWVLLTLPFISYALLYSPLATQTGGTTLRGIAILLLILIPITSSYERVLKHHTYPLDINKTHFGVSQFFHHISTDGNIVVDPSLSGIIQWELNNQYKIFMDMEFPPFTAWDHFQLDRMYGSDIGFDRFMDNYTVDFIVARKVDTGFIAAMENRAFWAPVFVTNKDIIYANNQTKPNVVAQYGISALNVSDLSVVSDKPAAKESELLKMLEINPRGEALLDAIYHHYIDEHKFSQAKKYAEKYLALYPYREKANYMYAYVQQNAGHYQQAIKYYKLALAYADEPRSTAIKIQLASCYFQIQDYATAYELLKTQLAPYRVAEKSSNLYMLALSAIVVGEIEESETFANMILMQEQKNSEMYKNAYNLIVDIKSGKYDKDTSWLNFISTLIE